MSKSGSKSAPVPDQAPLMSAIALQYEVEQFYYREAAFLDARQYTEWFALFTEDTHYFMPVRRTMTSKDLNKEFTKPGQVAFFDDDHKTLGARIKKLDTGYAWAEDPPSRQRHMVTNVRIISSDPNELKVESNFHLYRTRLNSEEDNWYGYRSDRLRRVESGFMIAQREIYLDQTVVLSRNLSNFF